MSDPLTLVDTSVWVRRRNPRISPWFTEASTAGEIALCPLVILELLRHVRTRDYPQMEYYLAGFLSIPVVAEDWDTAQNVQRALAQQTAQDHRKVKPADLLIAAAARRVGMILVHYDDDYERIQRVTGQPMRWVAPRGAL